MHITNWVCLPAWHYPITSLLNGWEMDPGEIHFDSGVTGHKIGFSVSNNLMLRVLTRDPTSHSVNPSKIIPARVINRT